MQTIRFSFCVCCIFLFVSLQVWGQNATLKGKITDKETGEPLIGATVQIVGTTWGTATDIDGCYELKVKPGIYCFVVKYVGYKELYCKQVKVDGVISRDFILEADHAMLDEVSVTAFKNMENERVLQLERQQAKVAVENLGAKEMSLKGISDVQEGVKKITGISIASAGQLVVRGLGDRYSTTTLNGLPIASPNPDNKLIPLDLFPSSTVQNITVSKVYEAGTFADYAGAHIDISTRSQGGGDFFCSGNECRRNF